MTTKNRKESDHVLDKFTQSMAIFKHHSQKPFATYIHYSDNMYDSVVACMYLHYLPISLPRKVGITRFDCLYIWMNEQLITSIILKRHLL